MPLILLTGLPCSGKTQRAEQLKNDISKRTDMPIYLINDEMLNIDKESYGDGRKEKSARSTLFSAVERVASKNAIVIVDALNYIKGFRYQIYCITRGLSDVQCTIHIGTPTNLAEEWNRLSHRYSEKTFNELIMRYEEPNDMNRWDSPLFTVLYDDLEPPYIKIWESLTQRKPKPPNAATISKPVSDTNFLYQLDATTQEIVKAIMDAVVIGSTKVAVGSNISFELQSTQSPSIAQLQRLRRQFISMNKMNTIEDMDGLRNAFINYLMATLKD